jgi:hypothetical protein
MIRVNNLLFDENGINVCCFIKHIHYSILSMEILYNAKIECCRYGRVAC